MKIKVINPNTTAGITNDICTSAHSFSRSDTSIVCVNPDKGPLTIEGFYDEYMAIPGLLEEVLKSEAEDNVDAYVVACFGDPGVCAVRELTEKPVVGIAQSAMMLASFVSGKFSIVTIMPRIRLMLEELVKKAGLVHRLASIRTSNLTVLDFMKDFEGCKNTLIEESKYAIENEYAEAIILGCAGMAGFAAEVQKETRVPVFDAVASAVKIAEVLVDMGMQTSKILTYKSPEKKEFLGMPELFQP